MDIAPFRFFDRRGPKTTPKGYQKAPTKQSKTFIKCIQTELKNNTFYVKSILKNAPTQIYDDEKLFEL